MARARKFSGKTVDEATEIALAELGAELEDVEIRVINTGRSGILGFGGEPAEIEVSLLSEGGLVYDDEFEDSADSEESVKASESGSSDDEGESEESTSRGRGRGRNRNRGRGRGRGGRRRNNRNGHDGEEVEQVEAEEPTREEDDREEEQQEERPSRGRRGRRGSRGGRGRGRGRNGRREDQDAVAERDDSAEQSDREVDSQPIVREKDEEAEQLVSELLDYFLGAMGVVADTYIRDDEEDGSLTFEIEGQDAGLLIGRRGETLQALQFIVRMVTNRQLGRKAYVVIDIEDYRERRIQMLRRLARRTAGRVASSGREDSLDPMSPAERRIVHMALANHPEVHTESEGEGNQRRVVIFPND